MQVLDNYHENSLHLILMSFEFMKYTQCCAKKCILELCSYLEKTKTKKRTYIPTCFSCPPMQLIYGAANIKVHEPQKNGHSPWSRDEGESIEEWGIGGDFLEEVSHHQRLYLDLRRNEWDFRLRGRAWAKAWKLKIKCLWAWTVCYFSSLRNKIIKADGTSLMRMLNSKPMDGQKLSPKALE